MTKVNKNNALQSDEVLLWLICAMYASLFFSITVSNGVLTLLLSYCIFRIKVKEIIPAIKRNIFSQVSLVMIAIQVLGLLYTTNFKTGFFILEKKITLLLIPIFFLPLIQKIDAEKLNQLLKKLGLITMLSSLVLLIIAFYRYYFLDYANAFSFESFRNFEGFSSIHYVYYSMYFACGSLIFLNSIYEYLASRKNGLWLLFGLFAYSLAIMILVASKTGLGGFVAGSIVLVYHKTKNKKAFVFFSASIILTLFAFLYANKTTRSRFSGLAENLAILKKDDLHEQVEFNDLNVRLVFWKISMTHLIKDNLILTGVGTGDAQDYIDSLYNLPKYQLYGYVGWDSHNQWVFTCVQFGLTGVILMGFLYAYYFKEAIKKRDLDLLIFLTVTFLFSLTESILESNKGIVFFTLFFSILSVLYAKNSASSSEVTR